MLNMNIVEQTQGMVEANFNNTYALTSQFLTNENVKNLIGISNLGGSFDSIDFWQAKNDFTRYCNDVVRNVGVYLQKSDILVDRNFTYTYDEYYDLYFEQSGHDREWWKDKLKNGTSRALIVQSVSNYNTFQEKVIIYIRPLNFADKKNGGIFIAMLSCDAIMDSLKSMGVDKSKSFAALNEDGSVVMSTDNFPGGIDLNRISGFKGKYRDGFDVVLYTTAEMAKLKYIYVFRGGRLAGNVHYFSVLFVLLLFIGLMASVLLARSSARRVQKPIQAIYNENKMLNESLNEQIENARKQILSNLLYNVQMNEGWMTDVVSKYGIGLEGDRYLVIAAGLSDFKEDEQIYYSDQQDDVWLEIGVISSQLLSKNGIAYRGYRMVTGLVYILCCYEGADLETVLEKIVCEVLDNREIAINIGAGDEVSDVTKVWHSYDGAIASMRFGQSEKAGGVTWYKDVQAKENSRIYYTKAKEIAIVRNIKTGSKENVNKILDEIYHTNFYERQLSYSTIKRLIANITLMIYSIVDDLYGDNPESYEKYGRVCQNILQNQNVEESFKILREVCFALCSEFDRCDDREKFKGKVIKYIEENYMDSNLTLATLADYMDINYHYLSRLFKEAIGTNFAGYLNSFRMEKANELLRKSSSAVKDISQQVGFTESNSFIRAYKKYYHTTPGKQSKK